MEIQFSQQRTQICVITKGESLPNKAFSERHLESAQKCVFLMKIDTFCPFSVKPAGRSLVENDRPPSFHGAPDGWDWARFLELLLSYSSFPFPSVCLPTSG